MKPFYLLLALLASCDDTGTTYLWIVPILDHRCAMGEQLLAAQEAALAFTNLDPAAIAPPETWQVGLDWSASPLGPSLDTALVVTRAARPSMLKAYVVESARGGCPTGTVLDAGYDVTWSLGAARGSGVLWTRSSSVGQARFVEFRTEVPLDQAPEPLRTLAADFPDPERPKALATLTVLDRVKGRDATWVLERDFEHDFSPFGREVTPRQWLLARGTWSE